MVLGSKLVNENNINTKPKKKKPINEFVGGSKLVNENNIIINMPEPVKKKRKKKPKMQAEPEGISDEAKRNFQETSSQYARGTYPPIPDSIDISKIKTTSALNAFTNTLRTTMGLPPVVPITSTASPTVPVVPVRPVLTETTTTVASIPSVATTSDLSPPIASVPTEYIFFYKLFTDFFLILLNENKKIDNKKIIDDTLLYYISYKNIFDNITDNELLNFMDIFFKDNKMTISDETKKQLITVFKNLYNKFKELSIQKKELIDDIDLPDISDLVKKERKERLKKITNSIGPKDIEEEKILLDEDKQNIIDENEILKEKISILEETLKKSDNLDPLFKENEKIIKKLINQEEENKKQLEQIKILENNSIEMKEYIWELQEMERILKETFVDFIDDDLQEMDNTAEQLIREKDIEANLSSSPPVDNAPSTAMGNIPSKAMGNMPSNEQIRGSSGSFLPSIGIQPIEGNTSKPTETIDKRMIPIEGFETDIANIQELRDFVEAYFETGVLVPIKNEMGKDEPYTTRIQELGNKFFKPYFGKDYYTLKSLTKKKVGGQPALMDRDELANEFINNFKTAFPNYFSPEIMATTQENITIRDINEFYNIYYPSPDNVFKKIGKLSLDKKFIKYIGFMTDNSKKINKGDNLPEIFKEEYLKWKTSIFQLEETTRMYKFINQYFPIDENGKRKFKPIIDIPTLPLIAELKSFIEDFIIKKDINFKSHYYDKYTVNFKDNKKGDFKLTMKNINYDELADKLLKDFTELYPEPEPEPEPEVNKTISPTKEDKVLLRTYADDNDLEQLQTLYKKYYEKDFIYNPDRTEVGEKVFDIVEAFKKGIVQPETGTTETGTTETGTGTQPETRTTETGTQPETGTGTQPETGTTETGTGTGTGTQPEAAKPSPETDPQTGEECLDPSRRSANCIKLSDYYRYLNDLSSKNETLALTDEYIKATGDDFNFINASNNIKIEKIKESNYKPTGKINTEFFDWAEKDKLKTVEPTPTTTTSPEIAFLTPDEYKRSIVLLTVENDTDKINAYFKGLMQWNADNGFFERVPRNISTEDKLAMLIRYKNQYQYTDINKTVEPDIINPQTNENQVNLAYKITNVSYEEERPRKIDQLILLNNYTNRNISVYQDGTTIYFCSTGSRAELSSQAAQDWLQSNIAILMGITTANLSGRFVEEKRVLDELVSTLRPTIIIFCGHSLGGRLSNELFTYSIESKRNVYQPFSITFNAGSVFHTSFTDKYNNEYLQHRVLQFHANLDPLSATNTIGTVVNVPFTGTYPHSMTNFENVDYSLYKNFVSEGLTFTETINPSYVVPEPIVAPKPEKETKLMDLIRKMYELEPDERYNNKTEQYIKAGTYYDENREYFSTADIEPFFEKYTINEQEFNFYMHTFLNFKRNPTIIDANQAELRPQTVVEEPLPTEAPQPDAIQPEATPQEPYRTPIGGVAGAVIGGSLGALASGGNPAIAGGTGAVGFLAGNALENAVRSLPAIAPPPPRPIYVPPPPTTPLNPLLFGGGFNTKGKKLRIPFNP